ncbi:MAG: hypothetical protein EA359_15005 [Balneolaceae bacterium]|nr:MAG: hypothetical protein EA359_15005 [Balneolaceae bacterium]
MISYSGTICFLILKNTKNSGRAKKDLIQSKSSHLSAILISTQIRKYPIRVIIYRPTVFRNIVNFNKP